MDQLHALEMKFLENYSIIAGRVQLVNELDLDRTFNGLKSKYPLLVVGEETSKAGVLHHHVYAGSLTATVDGLKTDIKTIYPDAIGNTKIYTKMARDASQLIKYTVKEKHFLHQGFSDNFIRDITKLGKSKEGCKKEFSRLEDKLILKAIDMNHFMEEYIALKVKYEQNLYDNHIMAYFKRMSIKVGEMSAKEYSKKFHQEILEPRW